MNAIGMCGPIDAGCYVDDAADTASRQRFVTKLHDIGFTHACVMIEGHRDALDDVHWSTAELERFARHAEPLGLARVATLWPEPSRKYVRQLREKLPAILDALGTRTVELDLEGSNWTAKKLQGFKTMDDAAADVLMALGALSDLRIEIVTFLARLDEVAGFISPDRLLTIMVYPRRVRDGKKIPYTDALGPTKLVGAQLDEVRRRVGPDVQLAAALPAWSQDWPGVEPFEAMRVAHAAAVDRGVRVARAWSSKWICGARANGYSADALRRLNAT